MTAYLGLVRVRRSIRQPPTTEQGVAHHRRAAGAAVAVVVDVVLVFVICDARYPAGQTASESNRMRPGDSG
jgi:hypothetical protein